MTRFLRVLLILVYFELGALLVFLPWSRFWESNYFLHRYPTIILFLLSPFLRGAITGLGLLDMALAAAMIRRRSRPILCYVTDRRALVDGAGAADAEARAVQAVLAAVERAIAAGVDWIQIREQDLPAQRLVELVRTAVAATRAKRTPPASSKAPRVLVNDRLDVAQAVCAAGVHLGEQSVPVAEVVRWRKEAAQREFLVGASCHSLAAAVEAERSGADYVIFGPVFATPSKAAYGAPQGLERLAEVCRGVKIPVLAIGGVTAENAAKCLAAGAAGIAAIRLFQEASDLTAVVQQIRSA